MANLKDYMAWRGEFSLEVSPWNEIDGLLMAVLSYLNFHGIADARGWTLREAKRIELLKESPDESFPPRKELFEAMADSNRFGESRLHHFIALTDEKMSMQFSAMCIDLPDGTMGVLFRGTDNTLIGWREDFNMAFQTRVPAQEAAGYYLARAARVSDRPLRLIGHSKGGNLAVYAAAGLEKDVQDRIESIWSYDGPGMNQEMAQTEGFLRIRERIRSYIPQTSIIGLLMEYYRPYTVVRSTASGIAQHDPLSWQVYGGHFEEMDSIDRTASLTCETLHEWLANSTPEQRGAFVDALFQLADSTKATRMSELLNEKFRSLVKMVNNRKDIDPETRRVFNRLVAQAVSLGFGNMVERVRGRSDPDGPGEWRTIDPEDWKKFIETEKTETTEAPAEEIRPEKRKRGRRKSKTGLDKTAGM